QPAAWRGSGSAASGRHNPEGACPTGLWHNSVCNAYTHRDVANCRAGGMSLDRGDTGSRASCEPWSLWEVDDGGPLTIVLRTVRTGFGSSSGTRNSLRPLSTTTKQKRYNMAIKLNHLIVPAKDKLASAQLFAEIFGLTVKPSEGRFAQVPVDEHLTIDFADDEHTQGILHFVPAQLES